MKRKISLSAALVLVLIGALLTFQITDSALTSKYQTKLDQLTDDRLDLSKLSAVDEIVRQRRQGALDEKALQDMSAKGYMEGLGDPRCEYLSMEELSLRLEADAGKKTGVGADPVADPSTGSVYVAAVHKGSPAEAAGIVCGDRIISVNGADPSPGVPEFYGAEGSGVTLELEKADGSIASAAVFCAPYDAQSVVYIPVSDDVGMVRITAFNSSSEAAFREIMDSCGVKKIVFDLRGSGGDGEVALRLLDYILSDCALARTYTDPENVSVVNATSDHTVDIKCAVLVDKGTFAGAELFAAVLRDCAGATLVGERTAGDAAFRTLIRLSDQSAIVLTSGYFAPPVSGAFEGVGLECDLEAASTNPLAAALGDPASDLPLGMAVTSLG